MTTATDHLLSVTYRAARVQTLEEEASGLDHARSELREAMRTAHQAGHSYRAIAQAAGLSHQRIAQLLQKEEK